jgi:hypothetical protein
MYLLVEYLVSCFHQDTEYNMILVRKQRVQNSQGKSIARHICIGEEVSTSADGLIQWMAEGGARELM